MRDHEIVEGIISDLEKQDSLSTDELNALSFLKKALDPPKMNWLQKLWAKFDVWQAKRRSCKHVFTPNKYYLKKTWRCWQGNHYRDDSPFDGKIPDNYLDPILVDVFLYEDFEERRCIKCGIDFFSGR